MQPSQCVPPPCSHFSFVDIGAGRVAKYGGKEQSGRTDALYILSLNTWVSVPFSCVCFTLLHVYFLACTNKFQIFISSQIGAFSNGFSDLAWDFKIKFMHVICLKPVYATKCLLQPLSLHCFPTLTSVGFPVRNKYSMMLVLCKPLV